MSLQVSLKLRLSKVNKKILAKYNTFEKATYDEYLSTSISLRSKNEEEANKYIDDITGKGSLNAHLKKLYNHSRKLSIEELENILSSSLYPVLKIDDSNRYVYFPELNISVFKGNVYRCDIESLRDLHELLFIKEKIIELSVSDFGILEKPEPYFVLFQDNDIRVRIENEWIDIDNQVFKSLLVNEIDVIDKYQGTIHKGADGDGWSILTNSTINNMLSNNNNFYEDGDNYQIRNENIRKTIVSSINGLYIYKEEILYYNQNKKLCEKVISFLIKNNSINEFKTKSLINILNNVEDTTAQQVINYILGRKDSKELSFFGIDLLKKGLEYKWSESSLLSFMKYSDKSHLDLIYRANPNLGYSIEKLILINKDYLIDEHLQLFEEYYNSLNAMKDSIRKIIGSITTSGLRETVKKLKSDTDTKKFSKLSNELIGHVKKDLEKADLNETKKRLEEAHEFENLSKKLLKKIEQFV